MRMPPPDEIWTLDTKHVGRRVCLFEHLGSTNTLASKLSHRPNENGLVVIAREQSAGRGQHGRSWQAPSGSSVLMSVLLFPPPTLRRPALFTAWAAVSVCKTVGKLAEIDATIKWPNDVLIHGKKVCGILIEQRNTQDVNFPLASVIGIGLNVTQSAEWFDHAGLPDAISLASAAGLALDYEHVAKTLIGELDEQYHQLIAGDFHALESEWKRRLNLLGKAVIAEGIRETYQGQLVDMALAGVGIEVAPGKVVRLASEAIRRLRER
jgi:BirA family transcriptional regulator, biotin operon repressor / biotin---[acetyl-CoA-carboxylase] ligase